MNFRNSLSMTAERSECRKCPTTPFYLIYIVAVITVTYGYRIFRAGCSMLDRFILGYKHHPSRNDPFTDDGDDSGKCTFKQKPKKLASIM